MTANKISIQSANKLLGLEVIRFLSAISVLIWHYQHFSFVGGDQVSFVKESQPFYSALSLFYSYGYYGVQAFWCISGFIFFWKYGDVISKKWITAKKFFVLRFSRLYPLHFVTLLLVCALQAIYIYKSNQYFVYQNNDLKYFLYQLFLASDWGFLKGYSFNGPIWSISVEVLVYFIFFAVLRLAGKKIYLNILVLILFGIAKYFKIENQIIDCLGFFYAGGLSALVLSSAEKWKYRYFISAAALGYILVAPVAMYIFPIRHQGILLLTYVPTLLYFFSKNIRVYPPIAKMIEALGNMTYSSYLIHFPIQLTIAIYYAYTNQQIPFYTNQLFLFFISITLILAFLIYRFLEMPAQNGIRNRFSRGAQGAKVQA